MKRCPSCNRTFDDTQNFCLEDATPLISEASSYDPAKTVLATGPGEMNNTQPPQTPSAGALPGYQPSYQQQWTPPQQQQWGAPPASRNSNKIIILAVVGLVVAVGIGLTIYFLSASSTASKRFVGTWIEEGRANDKGARFTEDGKIMVPHLPGNTMSATPSGNDEEQVGTYTVSGDKATIISPKGTFTGTLESDNRMRLEGGGKPIYLVKK
jgi:hypothetical protein